VNDKQRSIRGDDNAALDNLIGPETTEPATQAGRALLDDIEQWLMGNRDEGFNITPRIRAIEAEAVKPWRAALADAYGIIIDLRSQPNTKDPIGTTRILAGIRALLATPPESGEKPQPIFNPFELDGPDGE